MIKKIISGGQTGADRGGLEAAKALGIETGGYCPNGFLTKNGPDLTLKEFGLIELDTPDYKKRTIKNVEICTGVVIFGTTNKKGKLNSRGSILTFNTAKKLYRPVIVNPTEEEFLEWIKYYKMRILNIAGNRESENPGIQNYVKDFLIRTLKIINIKPEEKEINNWINEQLNSPHGGSYYVGFDLEDSIKYYEVSKAYKRYLTKILEKVDKSFHTEIENVITSVTTI
ncbi:MAG TPA: putative molybdenum carrier protein [Ignavibacteria bacterium]